VIGSLTCGRGSALAERHSLRAPTSLDGQTTDARANRGAVGPALLFTAGWSPCARAPCAVSDLKGIARRDARFPRVGVNTNVEGGWM
jgi:hypothetical protein